LSQCIMNVDIHVPPPQPSLNGGLYTGQSFAPGAPWGVVPVVPDAGHMIHYNLRSADPPPGAIYQYPGSIRPGNNFTPMYGIVKLPDKPFDMYCINEKEADILPVPGKNNNNRFVKYSYLS